MTTITITDATRRRLADYKTGDSTFDDVLNRLMDAVAIEDVMAEDIRLHYERLNDPKTEWVSADEMEIWLKKQIAKKSKSKKK